MSDLEKIRKKFAWLLRNDDLGFEKDAEGFVTIEQLVKIYNTHKRNIMYDDAYFCRFVFEPHDKHKNQKLIRIDKKITEAFILPCVYTTQQQFELLFEKFCSTYNSYFITKTDCINIVNNYSDQFMLNDDKTKIRAIRSWELI